MIEELVRQEDADEYVHIVIPAPGSPLVVTTIGVDGDPWAEGTVTALEKTLRKGFFENFGDKCSLLTRMWDPQRRPAVLVVIGHLTTGMVPSEAHRARIYVKSLEKYLDTDGLRRAKRAHGTKRWATPQRPIILLLGCDTGRSGIGETHSFVTSLASAGAATVIATEEKIDTRLAAGLAQQVVLGLQRKGAGEGLRAWRAQLMAEANPLGLVFTCFGSAGAVVPDLTTSTEGKP